MVPGGVDESGTHRVIPCLLWLLERVSEHHDVHVFAMRGGGGRYRLKGATVSAVPPTRRPLFPTLTTLLREHRHAPFAVVHAFWASGPGTLAALARPLMRRPILLHVTGGDLVALPEIGYGGRLTLRRRVRVRLALLGSSRRTAPTGSVLRPADRLGYPARRLPMGVSRTEWQPRAPQARDPDRPARLIRVGDLNRVKDHPTLLQAARRLADAGEPFTLDIVGTDTLDGEIQTMAATLGLGDRVRFHGFLPQRKLRPLVARADLHLVSSRHEAEPVAAAEAAMLGVPTVGTDVGLLSDWAPDAAMVVPVNDPAALAVAVLRLLRDEPLRLRIATAAHERASTEDADWTAARVLEHYGDLASGQP